MLPDHTILIHIAELVILIILGQVISFELDFLLFGCFTVQVSGQCNPHEGVILTGCLPPHSKDANPVLSTWDEMLREGVIACDVPSRDIELLHTVKDDLREVTVVQQDS